MIPFRCTHHRPNGTRWMDSTLRPGNEHWDNKPQKNTHHHHHRFVLKDIVHTTRKNIGRPKPKKTSFETREFSLHCLVDIYLAENRRDETHHWSIVAKLLFQNKLANVWNSEMSFVFDFLIGKRTHESCGIPVLRYVSIPTDIYTAHYKHWLRASKWQQLCRYRALLPDIIFT